MNKSSYYGEGSKLPGGIDLNGRYPLDYRLLINSWDPHDETYDIDTISFDSLYAGMLVSDSTGKVKVLETIPSGVTTAHECMWKEIGKVTSVSAGVGLTTSDGNAITTSGTIKAKLKSESLINLDARLGDTPDRQYAVELDQGGYLSVNVPWTDNNTTYNIATSSVAGLVKSSTTGTTANRDYNVQVNSDGTMKVNVPWTDTGGSSSNTIPAGTIAMTMRATAPSGWLMCDGHSITVYIDDPEDSNYKFCFVPFSYNGHSYVLKIWIDKVYVNLMDGIGTGTALPCGGQLKIGSLPPYSTVSISKIQNFQNNDEYTGNVNSGTLTFMDFSRRFPLGAQAGTWTCGNNNYNTSLGNKGGEETHTLTASELPNHNHSMNYIMDINGVKKDGTACSSVTSSDFSGIDGEMYNSQSKSFIKEVYKGKNDNGTTNSDPFVTGGGGGESHNNIPPFLAVNFMIKC